MINIWYHIYGAKADWDRLHELFQSASFFEGCGTVMRDAYHKENRNEQPTE